MERENDFPTAEQARKQLENTIEIAKIAEQYNVKRQIKNAISKQERNIYYHLCPENVIFLVSLGYKVIESKDDGYMISW